MAAASTSVTSEVAASSQPPILVAPSSKIEMAPSYIHSVLLANAKRIIISLHYDSFIFSLDRMEEIANLEDLSFVFAPRGEEKGAMTKFVFRSELSSVEILSKTARFRVGAMAAAAVGGETRVVCQSRGVATEEIEREGAIRMDIRVCKVTTDELSRSHRFFYSPNHQFLLTCGRRSFEVEGMTLVPNSSFIARPSPEIVSLHSPSCLALFYGDAPVLSVKREEEPIRISAISPALLQFALSLVAFGSRHRLAIPNSAHSMALVRFLDRLSFSQAAERFKTAMLNRILTHDVDVREDSLPFIDYLADDGVRKKFFGRFVFLECLSGMARRYAGSLSMSNLVQLDQRRVYLYSVVYRRPKIRFVFPEGQMVFALFNDFHPTVVDSLLSKLLNRASYRAHPIASRSTQAMLPLIDLSSPLKTDPTSQSRISAYTHAFWLSYSSVSAKVHKLFMCRGMPDNGLILGSMMTGAELIPVVVKNNSKVTYVSLL